MEETSLKVECLQLLCLGTKVLAKLVREGCMRDTIQALKSVNTSPMTRGTQERGSVRHPNVLRGA